MEEIWKDIVGYEGLYQVSTLGRIKSLSRRVWNSGMNCYRNQYERFLTLIPDKKGYLRVNLSKEGRLKQLLVHRIVIIAFLENPNNLPQVNHINEITSDNRINNLEWCTNLHNCNFGNHNSKVSTFQSEPITQYTLSGEFVRNWGSSREVERVLGYSNVNILRCCNGGFYSNSRGKFVKVNTAYGFKWKKIEGENKDE